MHKDLSVILESGYSDIPSEYTWEHLWKYRCYKLKTSRLKKKFRKNPKKYINKKLRVYLGLLDVGRVAGEVILEKMQTEGFSRKLFKREENGS